AVGRAVRPATTRGRSTTVPRRVSPAPAIALRLGTLENTSATVRRAANASTSGTRRKARSCEAVGSPANSSRSAARLDALNRASADSVRRAPAAAESTTAPTTPTNNVSTPMLRQRRRSSQRATNVTPPTTLTPRPPAPFDRCVESTGRVPRDPCRELRADAERYDGHVRDQQAARVVDRFEDRRDVERCHGPQLDYLDRDAVTGEFLGGGDRLVDHPR